MLGIAACIVLVGFASGADYEVVGENLVLNGGFEEGDGEGRPAGWNGARDVYSRDTEKPRSAEASLKYANDQAERYLLCNRPIALNPGRMYEVRGWIKTQSVEGSDSGATICMEWQDENGVYLGGHYPSGFKGDTEWQELVSLSPRLPENARNCTIACYLRKDMTGTAWWDDVSVREVRDAPLALAVLEPNYRNAVTGTGPDEVRVRVLLNLEDYELTANDVAVRWRAVHEASGECVGEGELASIANAEADLLIRGALLKEGAHQVTVSLVEKATDSVLSEKAVPLHRTVEAGQPKRYIDVHNRLIVDGTPFFPLGMYWSSIDAEQSETYAESAFNCLLPYGMPTEEQLDLAHAKDLKVIYTVKDCYFGSKYCPSVIQSEEDEYRIIREKVEAYRSHPAVLAWYINDELSLDYLDRLIAHKEFIHSIDPDHPTYAVLYQINQIRDYMPTSDAIGTDPYPIGRAPASQAGEWTRKTREAVFDRRPMWQVPQAFNWANYAKNEEDKKGKRAPTLAELRSMAWQCIAEGARGLIFYSWFDLRRDETTPFEEQWPRMKTVAAEIAELIPALLSVEEAPAITSAPNESVHWCVKQLDGTTYLIVVNATEEETSARFTLPKKPAGLVLQNTGEEIPGIDQTLEATFAALEVKVYTLRGLK